MEHLFQRFFNALPIRSVAADEDLHLLSPDELALVRSTERYAIAASVLIELAAYLLIFLPIYGFPEFFAARNLEIGGPFTHFSEPVGWVRQLWMLSVTLAELYVLLLLNLAAVHGIAVATGYIRRDRRAAHTDGLLRIALERKFEKQQDFGIDPFEGLNPWYLYTLLLLNRLKGLIGSVLFRAALSNLFGRDILRIFLDFSGMPIYMAINAYTTHAILQNARVVVMGQTSIEIVRRRLPRLALSPWEKELIYDTLQFIAVNKRDFHVNHFHLTQTVVEHFGIPVKPRHSLPVDYPDKLKAARPEVADICRLFIVLGFVLDGRLSRREYRQSALLRQQGILDLHSGDLQTYCRSFVDGQGLSGVTTRFIKTGA
jgi:hypothetical protein